MSNNTAGDDGGGGFVEWFVCLENPDLAECADAPSYYGYRLSIAANAAFLAVFAVFLIGYVGIYAATRRGFGFSLAMMLGVTCEVLGYAGRVMSWKNQWMEDGFMMQICCLTIAPAFMAAGVYLCLRRIVYTFGPENSRIPPEYYTRVFIPCDVVSLILQASGGALASIASHNGTSVETGDNIMIAGLSFQVLTLLAFMACSIDFTVHAWRRYRQLGAAAFDQDDAVRGVRNSKKFRGFLASLTLAAVCIFWRSVFRVAELSRGWEGPIMKRQDLFIGFEGVMIVVACFALLVFHPSVCFKELMQGQGGLGSWRRRKDRKEAGSVEVKSQSATDTDGMATP